MASTAVATNRKVVGVVFQYGIGLLITLPVVLITCGNVQAPQLEQQGGSGYGIGFGIHGIGAEGGESRSFVSAAECVTGADEVGSCGVVTHLIQPESTRLASDDASQLASWGLRLVRRATAPSSDNSMTT